jgi:hypothetical protein
VDARKLAPVAGDLAEFDFSELADGFYEGISVLFCTQNPRR